MSTTPEYDKQITAAYESAFTGSNQSSLSRSSFRAGWRAGVAAERERCARLCDLLGYKQAATYIRGEESE